MARALKARNGQPFVGSNPTPAAGRAPRLTGDEEPAERLDTGMVGINDGVVSNRAAPSGGVQALWLRP